MKNHRTLDKQDISSRKSLNSKISAKLSGIDPNMLSLLEPSIGVPD